MMAALLLRRLALALLLGLALLCALDQLVDPSPLPLLVSPSSGAPNPPTGARPASQPLAAVPRTPAPADFPVCVRIHPGPLIAPKRAIAGKPVAESV